MPTHAGGWSRTALTNRDQFSTADITLTEADMQDVRDAVDALVAETQTGTEIQESEVRLGAPVAVLV